MFINRGLRLPTKTVATTGGAINYNFELNDVIVSFDSGPSAVAGHLPAAAKPGQVFGWLRKNNASVAQIVVDDLAGRQFSGTRGALSANHTLMTGAGNRQVVYQLNDAGTIWELLSLA